MNKKILAFGASNSKNSINRQFAHFAAHQLKEVELNLPDLNDFEMPIYSIDREKDSGIPELAHAFKNMVKEADGIIISLAEHNGAYTVAFKNIMDWISRLEKPIWENKPMFLLATSPGGRGGRSSLDLAIKTFPYFGGKSIHSFCLPKFWQNFSPTKGIMVEELAAEFQEQLGFFQQEL
ncbi:MAG: NAD(P)H-dependent oxidoreductase [Bacteroidia bacterium]|nr:NAD(P)H-dependent oxidoreductase [Bacteroidia bacterium]